MSTVQSKSKPRTRIIAGGILQEFWDLFPKEESDRSKKHFKFHLCVFVDAHGVGPLHPRYEFCRDFGMPHMLAVYSRSPLPDGDLMFVFPDRWVPPKWAMLFVCALNEHPSILAKPRRRVMIVTMQPYFVGDCFSENVLVVRDPAFNEKEAKEKRDAPEGETFGLEGALALLGGNR